MAESREALETFPATDRAAREPANAETYLDRMLRLLRMDGVRFPNNKVLRLARLDATLGDFLHAEGEWDTGDGQTRRVAVSFGPQHGPVTAYQVENALAQASRGAWTTSSSRGFRSTRWPRVSSTTTRTPASAATWRT